MFRRHPILCSLALLLCGLLAAGSYWLLTFDLNQYRQQLETRFSQSLQRPVTLGAARLRLWRGPAVAFDALQIGPNEHSASSLAAEHLRLRLDGWALLRRQLTFRSVELEGARVQLVSQSTDGSTDLSPGSLAGIGIESLRIARSEVQWQDRRDPARPLALQVTAIEGELQPAGGEGQLQLRLAGELLQTSRPAHWSLQGNIHLPASTHPWRQTHLDLEGSLQGLAPNPLLRHFLPQGQEVSLQGEVNLQLRCRGVLDSGLQLDLATSGAGTTFLAPPWYRQPKPWPPLQLHAYWLPLASKGRWRSLMVTALPLGLAASAEWSEGEEGPWLQIALQSQPAPVREWLSYLPERASFPLLARLRQAAPGGSLHLQRLHFAGPPGDLTHAETLWPRLEGELRLQGGSWPASPLGKIQDLAGTFVLRAGALRLESGRGRLLDGEFRLSGEAQRPWQPGSAWQLQAQGELESSRLLALLPETARSQLTLTGPLTWIASLAGARGQVELSLGADLAAVAAQQGDLRLKEANQAAKLQAQGTLTPQRWELASARLELPLATLRLRGEKSRLQAESFQLELEIDSLDLATVRNQHPLLEKLQAKGTVALRLAWSATPQGAQRDGELTLRGVGLQTGRLLAPLGELTGRVRLDNDLARLEPATARLGKSPIHLQGQLQLGDQPQLELQLRAERLLADELIFPSREAQLRKVAGRLRINRQGIEFVSAQARLAGGTEARVRGRLTNFSAPEVDLEIEGERVKVEEVIALWRRPPDEPPSDPGAADRPRPRVQIRARAGSGSLYGMAFSAAEAQITLRDGLLTIAPLSFRSGPGSCVGRVTLEPRPGAPALLTISGHAEGMDAATVYQQLLRRKGLVGGALRADFQLAGEVGKTFLETANGDGSFTVSQGVLHRFQALGKVFSLLNVSQLLTLRLPDMASEGMPFDQLSATLVLRDGVLSSEDLFIESNAINLSLVGQIDLPRDELDLLLGVKPLRTVDQIVTRIPIAGWLLTGEEKALVTAHFQIRGPSKAPEVSAIPISSLSKQVLGIFQRVLGLPGKLIEDASELLQPATPAEKPTGRQ